MFQLNRAQFSALILSFTLVVIPTYTYAAEDGEVTEVSLLLQTNDILLIFPDSVTSTKVSTAQVTWWQEFSESLEARLSLSYIELSQKNNSSVLAYNATGYDIGIGFRGAVIKSEIVDVGLSVTLDYLSTTGETNLDEAIEISWLEYSGSVDFEFIPSSPVTILAGASYTAIDGEHEVINTANSLSSFSEDESAGYYGGLSFKSNDGGNVSLTWHGGHREGVYLTFSKRFR